MNPTTLSAPVAPIAPNFESAGTIEKVYVYHLTGTEKTGEWTREEYSMDGPTLGFQPTEITRKIASLWFVNQIQAEENMEKLKSASAGGRFSREQPTFNISKVEAVLLEGKVFQITSSGYCHFSVNSSPIQLQLTPEALLQQKLAEVAKLAKAYGLEDMN